MRLITTIFGLAALVSASAQAAPVELSPAVKKDVQCFLLYAAAAGNAQDDKAKQGAAAGTMYYLGRIDVASPRIDLAQAVQQEATAFQSNGKDAERIGAACDAELSKRGSDMMTLGKALIEAGR